MQGEIQWYSLYMGPLAYSCAFKKKDRFCLSFTSRTPVLECDINMSSYSGAFWLL